MMLLTTATAWAFKAETTSYSITYSETINEKKFHITVVNSSETDSWGASVMSGQIYWKGNETHLLANGMTIKPDAEVYYANNSIRTKLNSSTTFTFTAPTSNIAITSVVFKNGDNVVSSTNSANVSTYTVTLAQDTPFTGFEVTYGTISGSCGTGVTWTLSQQNGQYTALTISGSGAMTNDYNHETVDGLWRTDAP